MSEWTFETDYFKGYEEGKRQAERTYNLKQAEKGRQEVINDIIKILYDAHLTDKEALIEIMKYCGVYEGEWK